MFVLIYEFIIDCEYDCFGRNIVVGYKNFVEIINF